MKRRRNLSKLFIIFPHQRHYSILQRRVQHLKTIMEILNEQPFRNLGAPRQGQWELIGPKRRFLIKMSSCLMSRNHLSTFSTTQRDTENKTNGYKCWWEDPISIALLSWEESTGKRAQFFLTMMIETGFWKRVSSGLKNWGHLGIYYTMR